MPLLFLDIETSPMVIEAWSAYDANSLHIREEMRILGFAYAKDAGKVRSVYHPFGDDADAAEKSTLVELWFLLDEADIVVAHNGDKYDLRKINARFIKHGMRPPTPYRTVDTLKAARRYASFPKNRLGDLGEYLDLGGKEATGGYGLWRGCLEGDESAWKKMAKYNRRDVALLRDVYFKLRPWIENHPHVGGDGCPRCGSMDSHRRGNRKMKSGIEYVQHQCTNCDSYYRSPRADASPVHRP